LVESIPNNFLVAVLIHFVVQVGNLGHLVVVKGLFASLTKSTKLGELGPVIDLGH
jgi:hypothetical protein